MITKFKEKLAFQFIFSYLNRISFNLNVHYCKCKKILRFYLFISSNLINLKKSIEINLLN